MTPLWSLKAVGVMVLDLDGPSPSAKQKPMGQLERPPVKLKAIEVARRLYALAYW